MSCPICVDNGGARAMARGSKASELLQVASWAPQQRAIYHVLIQLSQDNVFVISHKIKLITYHLFVYRNKYNTINDPSMKNTTFSV